MKDPTLDLDDVCLKQLSRFIHLGLLCVEQDPNNRPDMDAINHMLRNDSITIPPLPRLPSRMDFSQILDSMNKSSDDMPSKYLLEFIINLLIYQIYYLFFSTSIELQFCFVYIFSHLFILFYFYYFSKLVIFEVYHVITCFICFYYYYFWAIIVF